MIRKTSQEEILPYLKDASNMPGGHAQGVVCPENEKELTGFIAEANAQKIPVTIAGNGTGLAGGRVPMGGWVLSLERLNKIKKMEGNKAAFGGTAVVDAGLCLRDFLNETARNSFYYPPDPTSWPSCLGGNVACNASGPRTFKHGATRDFVTRLKVVLTNGEVLDLKRGDIIADSRGVIALPAKSSKINVPVPTYLMPPVKNTAGYYAKPGLDAVDLFIGSEGTLGIISEIEIRLLTMPVKILSFAIFFPTEELSWDFADAARSVTRRNVSLRNDAAIQASAIEYLDNASLDFVRDKFPEIPSGSQACIMIEQECQCETEDMLMDQWGQLIERFKGEYSSEWFADDAEAQSRLKKFRHAVPMAVKEFLIQHGQPKVGTDTAVPYEKFKELMLYHRKRLEELKLPNLTFGHIGDSHVHLNILSKTREEHERAWALYRELVEKALQLGGTVSAEHGIGKLKHPYLRQMFGEQGLKQMAALKKALDPNGILGRGNIFPESLL